MSQEIPETIPITEEIQAAILQYLEREARVSVEEFWTSELESLRVKIGVAVLRALGLFDPPRIVRRSIVEPEDTAPRRRALPFILRAKVMARDGFECVKCHAREALTIDHIVPIVKGGSDDEANLRTLCGTCNFRKGARDDS